jgi:hypothetical protein
MSKKPADDAPAPPFTGLPATSLEMIRKFWESATGSAANVSGPMAVSGLPSGMPSIMAPTLDVGEIDKHIAELRTVEQWLQLNTSMLRSTIQTLEIQRNTIATLRSFGGAFSDAMQNAAKPAPTAESTLESTRTPRRKADAGRKATRSKSGGSTPPPFDPAAALKPDPALWWNALQQQFTQLAEAAIQPAAPAAAKPRKRSGG